MCVKQNMVYEIWNMRHGIRQRMHEREREEEGEQQGKRDKESEADYSAAIVRANDKLQKHAIIWGTLPLRRYNLPY